LQGAALLVDAVTGINLFATEVNTASLSNTGSGSIRLVETAAGGALTLLKAKLGNASDTTVTSGMVSVQTLSTTDGDLTLISTPKGTNHFYEQFSEGIKTDHDRDEFFSLQSPSSDNPMVVAKFLEKQKKLLSASAYQTDYEAKFVQHDGYVYARDAV
jgi:hypothetical protein